MKIPLNALAAAIAFSSSVAMAASHREAPITALDRSADITDFYAFVSPDNPETVTFILNVDPFLEPSNGPNYFPFDPDILYAIRIDNNYDAVEDIVFQFRFHTEIRLPGVFTGFVGAGDGISAPLNSPPPVAPGTPIIPPAITALDGPGSEGFSLRQTYSVTMVRGSTKQVLSSGNPLYAVPSNVGPRTMPQYPSLYGQGIYQLGNGVKVFAGTVDDPFWIDLGGAFDTLNFHNGGVLTAAQDADDYTNTAKDNVAGFNVNAIAIQVPKSLIVGAKPIIGAWGTTSRPQVTVRRSPLAASATPVFRQVQRLGNPLINELIIGTGSKDRFSMDQPKNDSQFANFFLDPLLARVINAAYGGAVPIPPPPRTDLLLLVNYVGPLFETGTPGPIADLLRLNTSMAPASSPSRLGVLAGDLAGFPNGRRLIDDVTDIAARAVVGVLVGPPYSDAPNKYIGDGVNVNDVPYQEHFPYLGYAHSGRDHQHQHELTPTP